MNRMMKLTALAACVGAMLSFTGCGAKGPDAVTLDVLHTLQVGKASTEYLVQNCTPETAQLFTLFGVLATEVYKGATFIVIDAKINGDKAVVMIKQDGGRELGTEKMDLVQVDGKWKLDVNTLPFVERAEKLAVAEKLEMYGRNLYVAFMQANIDRETHGLASLWPHTSEENGLTDDITDIAGKKFSSATAYFKALFDVDGNEPYIDANQAFAMAEGKSIWCVAQGVVDEMSANVPFLISANFDCSALPCTWTGSEADADKTLTIGSLGGMGDFAIIVVYKGGQVKVLRKEDVTLHSILGNAPIDILPQSWLGPENVTTAKNE